MLFFIASSLLICSCDSNVTKDFLKRFSPKSKKQLGVLASPPIQWKYNSFGLGGGNKWRGVAADKSHLILYNDFSGTFVSHDSGRSWSPANSGMRAGKIYDIVTAENKKGEKFFIAGMDSGIYRSTDNGNSWERTGWIKKTKVVKQFTCVNSFAVNKNKPWNIIAVEASPDALGAAKIARHKLWRSIDAGITWKQIIISSVDKKKKLNRLCWLNDSIYALVNNSELHVSKDSGRTWSKVNINISLSNITTITVFKNKICVAGNAEKIGDVWKDSIYSSISGLMWKKTFIPLAWKHKPKQNPVLQSTEKGIVFIRNNFIAASTDNKRWRILINGHPKTETAAWLPPQKNINVNYVKYNDEGLWLFGDYHVYKFNIKKKSAVPVSCSADRSGWKNTCLNNAFLDDAIIYKSTLFPVWNGYYPSVSMNLKTGKWQPLKFGNVKTDNCTITAGCISPDKWQAILSFKNWNKNDKQFFSVFRSRDAKKESFTLCRGLPDDAAVKYIVNSGGGYLASGDFKGIYISNDGVDWEPYLKGINENETSLHGWKLFGNDNGIFAKSPEKFSMYYLIRTPSSDGGWNIKRWFHVQNKIPYVNEISSFDINKALLFSPGTDPRMPGVFYGEGEYTWNWERTHFVRAQNAKFFTPDNMSNTVYFSSTGIKDGPRALMRSNNNGKSWNELSYPGNYIKERLLINTGKFRGKDAAFFGGPSGLIIAQ